MEPSAGTICPVKKNLDDHRGLIANRNHFLYLSKPNRKCLNHQTLRLFEPHLPSLNHLIYLSLTFNLQKLYSFVSDTFSAPVSFKCFPILEINP